MSSLLIVYSSTDGHTLKICRRLAQVVAAEGHRVELAPIEEIGDDRLAAFDRVVIGARIRYGRHDARVLRFVSHNAAALQARRGAFFSVNIVARKPGRDEPATNPYVQRFLRQVAWRPAAIEVFAGKLDYPRYGRFDRLMIRLIMWLTKGPTDPSAVVEFTDWARVEAFGRRIAAPA